MWIDENEEQRTPVAARIREAGAALNMVSAHSPCLFLRYPGRIIRRPSSQNTIGTMQYTEHFIFDIRASCKKVEIIDTEILNW